MVADSSIDFTNQVTEGDISIFTTPFEAVPSTQRLSFQFKTINPLNNINIKLQGSYGVTSEAIFATGNIMSGINIALEEMYILNNGWNEVFLCIPGTYINLGKPALLKGQSQIISSSKSTFPVVFFCHSRQPVRVQ